MADSNYASAAGFIQFDVKTRDVNGQTVRDIVIKAVGTNKLVQVTVWPEFDDVALDKGDFVAVDGKFTSSMGQAADGSPREYFNVSAGSLAVLAPATKKERTTTQAPGSTTTAAAPAESPF